MVNFGNVRMVGFDAKELQSMYKVDIHNNANGVLTPFYLPEDIILNTRRAFSISPTSPTGYSDLGVPRGPLLRASQQRKLRSAQGRRLRAADVVDSRAVLCAR